MAKVKIAILASYESEGDYGSDYFRSEFIPVHLSQWSEVDEVDVIKVQEGLNFIKGNIYRVGGKRMKYTVFVKPPDECQLIFKSIEAYNQEMKRLEEERVRLDAQRKKADETDKIKRAENGIKRVIKQLEAAPATDPKTNEETIAALNVQLEALKLERQQLKKGQTA